MKNIFFFRVFPTISDKIHPTKDNCSSPENFKIESVELGIFVRRISRKITVKFAYFLKTLHFDAIYSISFRSFFQAKTQKRQQKCVFQKHNMFLT